MLSWVPALQAGEQNQSPGTKPIPETSLLSPIRFLTCWRSMFLKSREIYQLLRTSPGNQSILLRAEPPAIYPLWLLPSTFLQPQPLSVSCVETHTPPWSPCSPKHSSLERPLPYTADTLRVRGNFTPQPLHWIPSPKHLNTGSCSPWGGSDPPCLPEGDRGSHIEGVPGSQRQGATLDWNGGW